MTTNTQNIKIGISACLTGLSVRHDGGHTRNKFITEQLGHYFELVPYCPEVAAGMGTPRAAIQLRLSGNSVRAVGTHNPDMDVTEALGQASAKATLAMNNLSGYVLKKDSPSCGMERVRIYSNKNRPPERSGRGIFATRLLQDYPDLPVEEEGRLNDPVLRENFVTRVYIYHQWQAMMASGITVASFQNFHAQHKYRLLAHDESCYRRLGPRVARTDSHNLVESSQAYFQDLMQALKKPATRKRHSNVLMHIMGYLKHTLSQRHKQEFIELLGRYRRGELPLIVPVTLLRHHFLDADVPYINMQSYMQPYPEELALMNQL